MRFRIGFLIIPLLLPLWLAVAFSPGGVSGREIPAMNVNFSKAMGCRDITVNTGSFTVSCDRYWCHATAYTGEKRIRVSVSGNKSKRRTATLTLSSAGVPDVSILVQQEGADLEDITLSLLSVDKIWDNAIHSAFTDLAEYKGKYYCAFREGNGHVPDSQGNGNGKIRVLMSDDGTEWSSVALLQKTDCDLRDSKLSVTPDGRLMLLMGGSMDYVDGIPRSICSQVSFMDEAGSFSPVSPVSIDPSIRSERDWLWQVTWYNGIGYGVVYRKFETPDWSAFLVKTTDGVEYQLVTQLQVADQPNEASVAIEDNEMCIAIRRESGDYNGRVGFSPAPFTKWSWYDLGIRLGGPDLIVLPNGIRLLGSRGYRAGGNYTALFGLNKEHRAVNLLELPSGGTDTGYPGLLLVGDELWVSYYSTHEPLSDPKTSIFLAKARCKYK